MTPPRARFHEALAAVLTLRQLDIEGLRRETMERRERMAERGWGAECFADDLRLLNALERARDDVECAIREPSDSSCGVPSSTQPSRFLVSGETDRTSRVAAPSGHSA